WAMVPLWRAPGPQRSSRWVPPRRAPRRPVGPGHALSAARPGRLPSAGVHRNWADRPITFCSRGVDTRSCQNTGPAGSRAGKTEHGDTPMTLTYEFLANWLRARVADSERGASLVEYALLVALIAVVCIAAVTILGNNASNKFSSVGGSIA